jgi:NADH dehydrogenase [ubiquinone] 1 alpha subcomplex assembly factor 7
MMDTPLARKLKARIARDGPIGVADYMKACLGDPEHGYYRRRPAIGAAGDFVTAPEISQVFGELIGLWCAVVWQQMGSPRRINLIELGPGRGTLMRDALRATRIVPGFRDALSVHLVDSNATLRERQAQALADAGVPLAFHEDALDVRVPDGPTLLVANEFLDALPVDQFVFTAGRWYPRAVTVSDDRFQLVPDLAAAPASPAVPHGLTPQEGDIFEVCADHTLYVQALLATQAGRGPLAALFIDYGHASTGFGDTLQGVAGQAHVSPFHAPGDTDLSAQVDFQHFAEACSGAGLAVDGPLPQGEFLGRLGVIERASRLMGANPAEAAKIEAGVARLIAPAGMGSHFLALGVRSAALAPLPGLA